MGVLTARYYRPSQLILCGLLILLVPCFRVLCLTCLDRIQYSSDFSVNSVDILHSTVVDIDFWRLVGDLLAS
jgi:hypothetical protein